MNGQWLKSQTIPADESNYSAFSELSDRTEKQLLELIQSSATNADVEGNAQKVGHLYSSFMDEARANKLGLQPLGPDLRLIERLSTHHQLPELIGQLDHLGMESFFSGSIYEDSKNPNA